MNRVLVLDDDPDIGSVVTLILKMHGYSCEYITNYKDLDNKIDTFLPDLLILDISLGGADGRYICKQLKEREDVKHLHIILFSANRDATKEYRNWKAEAFIPKPFDSKQLISTVETVVSKNPPLN